MRSNIFTSPFSNSPETVIRVVSTTTTGFTDPTIHHSTVWQGSDIDELSRQYPPSEIWGADPLFHKEIEDGWIRTDYRFEQFVYGSWEEIDDPRRRLTPMTDYEREIDAENRRLYPGDYLTYDCDRCGDYGCDECEDPYPKEPEYECDYCRDHGCPSCEPENYCGDCENSLLGEEGPLCSYCKERDAYYADHPYRQCGLVSVAYGVDICNGCEHQLELQQFEADQAYEDALQSYEDAHCRNCNKELSDGENWICGDCERELEAKYATYKEWWIDPEDNRLKRTISWLKWMRFRIRRSKS